MSSDLPEIDRKLVNRIRSLLREIKEQHDKQYMTAAEAFDQQLIEQDRYQSWAGKYEPFSLKKLTARFKLYLINKRIVVAKKELHRINKVRDPLCVAYTKLLISGDVVPACRALEDVLSRYREIQALTNAAVCSDNDHGDVNAVPLEENDWLQKLTSLVHDFQPIFSGS